jgi:GDP-4-dehydro-6-deoxy-D-mannose reductase
VTSTANLLDALSTHAPGARVVVAGSSAEYGVVRDSPVGEDCPTDPVNDYGSSKLAQTLLALSYRHQGLDVRVARIFNAMGPGMPESLALGSFARQIADIEEGRQPPKILVGNLSSSRDYVDARDVARALLLLSRRGRSGGIYNVCSGRVQRMDALLRQLLSLASKSISVVRDPGRIRRGEVSRIFGSPAKLRRDTGWTPQIPLPQSLRDTLRWHLRP